MNTIYFPLQTLKRIGFIVDNLQFNQNQKLKIQNMLIELWWFLFLKFDNYKYVNITKEDFESFKLIIDKKKYRHQYFLELLEAVDLIKINNRYSAGNFSKGYSVIIPSDPSVQAIKLNFKKIFKDYVNKSQYKKKFPKYVKQIDDAYKVSIDLENYFEWLDNNVNTKLKPKVQNHILTDRHLTIQRIIKYKNEALKINFKNLWFAISNEGRFYSSLTNLSSTALPFLSIDNMPLVEVDVKNCQPLLLSTLISNPLYKKACEDGILYDIIADEMNLSRDKTKLTMFKHVFFANKPLKSGQLYEAMENKFEGLIGALNELRNNRGNLSVIAQAMESEIFVNRIGSSCNFPIMLRHDAIFVSENYMDSVKFMLKLEFKKIGLNVKLS